MQYSLYGRPWVVLLCFESKPEAISLDLFTSPVNWTKSTDLTNIEVLEFSTRSSGPFGSQIDSKVTAAIAPQSLLGGSTHLSTFHVLWWSQ